MRLKRETYTEEAKWLAEVYHELDSQLAQVQQNLDKYRTEMRNIRTSLHDLDLQSPSPGRMSDAAQHIAQLEHSGGYFGLQRKLWEQLKASEKAPYFGRIDFHEEGLSEREAMYIGIRSIFDQATGWPIVYDWRAPVSSMFYDYGLGEAEYEGPGGVYRGTIYLKRQYKIEERKLVYMFDNDLKIDDQILQEVLAKQTSQKMRNLVNTIQREQNRAIRNDRDALLLVEGPAGSGKTSVAMHRIAYLLYRQRSSLSAENVLVFSPSKIFSDYISNVLPELGEENVPTLTFKDFAERFLNWEFEVESQFASLERLARMSGPKRQKELEIIAFKSSNEFLHALDRLVKLIEEEAAKFSDIRVMGRRVMTKRQQERLFNDSYRFLPVRRRLAQIFRRFLYLLRPIKKELIKEILEEVRTSPAFEDESWWTIAREAIGRVRRELDPVVTQVRSKLQVDPYTWYQRLWTDHELWQQAAGDLPFPDRGRESLGVWEQGMIAFSDVPGLLYLKGELEGYPRGDKYLHVIVDEVQDYGPLQLAFLTKAFPNARFTFVGDAYQSLSPFFWENAVSRLGEAFGEIEPTVISLTKSYRSTLEIFQFCNAVLASEPQAESVLREGEKPIIARLPEEDVLENIKKHILSLRVRYPTVAVICPTLAECEELYSELSGVMDDEKITLVDENRVEYPAGILVLPVYLAKGLEFDAVVLPEVNDVVYAEEFQRRLLYVACSRALHALRLLYTGNVSPLLAEVPESLFTWEEGAE